MLVVWDNARQSKPPATCIHTYIHTYIYICRERERDRNKHESGREMYKCTRVAGRCTNAHSVARTRLWMLTKKAPGCTYNPFAQRQV